MFASFGSRHWDSNQGYILKYSKICFVYIGLSPTQVSRCIVYSMLRATVKKDLPPEQRHFDVDSTVIKAFTPSVKRLRRLYAKAKVPIMAYLLRYLWLAYCVADCIGCIAQV